MQFSDPISCFSLGKSNFLNQYHASPLENPLQSCPSHQFGQNKELANPQSTEILIVTWVPLLGIAEHVPEALSLGGAWALIRNAPKSQGASTGTLNFNLSHHALNHLFEQVPLVILKRL